MKELLGKFLCFLYIHDFTKWVGRYADTQRRVCKRCDRVQSSFGRLR